MHDVAEGAKPHDQDIHCLSGVDPCTRPSLSLKEESLRLPHESATAGRAWSDPWVADDRDTATVAANRIALGHGVDRVVGPLAMHVGTQRQQKRRDVGFRKDRDVVHAAQGGDELRPISRGQDGLPWPLQPLHRRVVVDRHHEAIGFARRRLEVANVADMQQIEAAVRKGNRATGRSLAGNLLQQRLTGKNAAHSQSACGRDRVTKLRRADRSGAAFHDDDASGVIREVRRFLECPASRTRQGHRRDDRIAGSRHVGDLIRAHDGNVHGRTLRLEQRHSAAAACHEHRLRARASENLPSGSLQRAQVVADPDAECVLDFRLVRRTGRHAAIPQQGVSGIDERRRCRRRAPFKRACASATSRWRHQPASVIRHQQSAAPLDRGEHAGPERCAHVVADAGCGRRDRSGRPAALPNGCRPPGSGSSSVSGNVPTESSSRLDATPLQNVDQPAAWLVATGETDRADGSAKCGGVRRGVAGSPGTISVES